MGEDDDAFLRRQLYALIVAQLRDDSFLQVASKVASVTMTPIHTGLAQNRLLDLVRKGLALEKEEFAGTAEGAPGAHEKKGQVADQHLRASLELPPTPDFSEAVGTTKGALQTYPKIEGRVISEHKNVARCARFSGDGRLLATGSSDTAIKLFEVDKIRHVISGDGVQTPETRPLIRTFFDHTQAINDVDFHPSAPFLISGAKDNSIKFFDFGKPAARRAFRVIQDTHNVRSVSFHPSGDFLLAGTDHNVAHLYDVNTFQCFVSGELLEAHVGGPINQVRYSATGGLYVTASKEGAVRVWDGVSARCVRVIANAHSGQEATSAAFTRDNKYVLSCGKDSAARLWEVSTGRQLRQYVGAQHTSTRSQAALSFNENFVSCLDEMTSEVVVWDSLRADIVARLPSGHAGLPRWIEQSPVEQCFVTCGSDRSIRFWMEA